MIKVLLFGRLSELHQQKVIEVESGESSETPEAVRAKLSTDHPSLAKALNEPQVLVAVNQEIVSFEQKLKDGDELAFLPPVTGG